MIKFQTILGKLCKSKNYNKQLYMDLYNKFD